MWTIRQEQVETFRHYHLQKFEDGMVNHLVKFAPKHWRVIGEQTGRQAIRFGIQQAKRYGFTNQGPVRFYIDLMFVFGSFFDTDPQLPWVSPILQGPEMADQTTRAERLFDEFKKYITRVRGLKHAYFIEALRRLNGTPIEKLILPGKDHCSCSRPCLLRSPLAARHSRRQREGPRWKDTAAKLHR